MHYVLSQQSIEFSCESVCVLAEPADDFNFSTYGSIQHTGAKHTEKKKIPQQRVWHGWQAKSTS